MPINLAFEIKGLDQELRVARFDGREGISELFELDLLLTGDAAQAVEIDDALGQDALFTLQGVGAPRHVHGVITRFQHADVRGGAISYVATLAPRVHRLLHRHDCRIFQPAEGGSLTLKEILPLVLDGASLAADKDYRLALRGTYPAREYCVQYRESDWAFLSRLMEEEGVHYFFEHSEDGHVLVIADSPAAHADLPGGPVRFHASTGALLPGEHIHRFHFAGSLGSDKVTLRDYNFEKPRDLLQSTAKVASDSAHEIYDYPGAFTLPAGGDRRASIGLEAQQARRRKGEGLSACARLVPGGVLELVEHPREAMNRKYLITRVEHTGYAPDLVGQGTSADEPPYESHFVCIPDDVPFRPPRITHKPVITGVQTAMVVCPSGEEVEPDKHGRVKVAFHWDRQGKSSCWVRVGQAWAGAGFGAMFIPRKGQEVLVDFLEGDPDRPVIVGSLYHGVNVTPYPLPAEKTKSTIKTNSSPGGEGFNELRFEDKKGKEEVYLHAQKDWNIEVLNDQTATVGHDQATTVKNDRRLQVTANEAIEVGKNRTDKVGGDETLTVTGQRKRDVGKGESETIAAEKDIKVGKDLTEAVDGNVSRSAGKDRTDYVAGKSTERVDGDSTLKVGGSQKVTVQGDMSTTVTGSQTEDVKAEKSITVGDKLSITCGSAKVTVEKDGKITIEGGEVTITATGGVSVKGGKLQVEASGAVTVKGGNVTVKGGTVGIN